MTLARRTGLAFRLFGVGLLQLALLVAAALVVSVLVTRYWTRWDMPAVVEKVEPLLARPADLTARLKEIREAGGPDISVYGDSRQLLASNVEPVLTLPDWSRGPGSDRPRFHGPPPTALEHLGRLLIGRDPRPGSQRHSEMFCRLGDGGRAGALVMRRSDGGPGAWPLLLTLGSAFLVVGLGALLTARFTIKPLGVLAGAAARFGSGDLSARTALSRRDEIGDLAQAFDEMAERIQALVRMEKELMANVAHELRTPLSRIRVALELAAEGDAAEARASLSEIAVDLSELERLVGDVLTTTSLELSADQTQRAGLPLSLAAVPARQIAEEAASRFRSRYPARPLSTTFEAELPELNADSTLLRRALDNLLENAHKYSPLGNEVIRLVASRNEGKVSYEVVDAGMGIDVADLGRVFSPFFRAERSRTRSAGGVGLGLTLAKQIVEAHGGTLELASAPGQGTTAQVLLPVS